MPWAYTASSTGGGIELYETRTKGHQALTVSYPVETFRHASTPSLEGADLDLPPGAQFHIVFHRALGALTRRAAAC